MAGRNHIAARTVSLIGAPFVEGQNLEGADLAPLAMREAGLSEAVQKLGIKWHDAGDISFPLVSPKRYTFALYREWLRAGTASSFSTWMKQRTGTATAERADDDEAGSKAHGDAGMAAGKKRSHQEAMSELSRVNVVNAELMGAGIKLVHDAVAASLGLQTPSPFVLTVGGDHSIASGSISAVCERYPDLGVIWVDAHADANTPRTSPSGHYHGMPAAHLLGWFDKAGEMGDGVRPGLLRGFEWFKPCLSEPKLAYIGLRDIDVEEGRMLRASGVRVFTMRDVDKLGIARVIEMAIEAVGPALDCPLHLSLDIDSVDPHFAPGTGTAARGGLDYREVHYICEELALTRRLVSMDLVEVNPGLDLPPPLEDASMHGDDPSIKPASPTVRLAVELCLSALGKVIC